MYYKIREGIRVLLAIKSCFKILPSSYIYSMVITVIHKPFQGMYTAAKAILMKLTENNKMESNLLEGAFNTFRVRIYNTYIRMHTMLLSTCMHAGHAYTLTHTNTFS